MLSRCSVSITCHGMVARTPWAAGRVVLSRRRLSSASPLAEVVRGSEAGLLVQSTHQPGSGSGQDHLGAGSVVRHGGNPYVCVFRVDRYWFAAPLGTAAPAARWLGGPDREAPSEEVEVVSCLARPTPTQKQRIPLSEGITTGLISVDTLSPLGRGQSMLVCGPRGAGKSTLAREVLEQVLTTKLVDRALRFRLDPSAPLVSACLQSSGAFSELAAIPEAAMQAPATLLASFFAAVGAAERVRDSGGHALLVLDTIAPLTGAWNLAHSWAEDALGRPIDPDVLGAQRRACFSALLERAACLKPTSEDKTRGGSLTMLVLAETEAMRAVSTVSASSGALGIKAAAGGKVFAYSLDDFKGRREKEISRLKHLVDRGIPLTDATLAAVGIAAPESQSQSSAAAAAPGQWNRAEEVAAMRELQSLSDGQVILDGAAAAAGDFPALVSGATFSRFGLGGSGKSDAQPDARQHRDVRAPALQAVAAHLRLQLALERDAGFRPGGQSAGQDADGVHSARMAAVRASLLQPPRTPMQTEEMAAVLLSACSGALDALPADEAARCLRGGSGGLLLQHLREAAPKVLQRIAEEKELSVEAARELEVAVRLFVALRKAGAPAAAAAAGV
mmetsp:Transcript_43106/g.121887  ORF Transcript_43106/g.121887 Transcript_43106/m.121887 type:complete len:618 (-) Transcript_43106:17-1870(-)